MSIHGHAPHAWCSPWYFSSVCQAAAWCMTGYSLECLTDNCLVLDGLATPWVHSLSLTHTHGLSLTNTHTHWTSMHALQQAQRMQASAWCNSCYNSSVCRATAWCMPGCFLGCLTGNCLVQDGHATAWVHIHSHTHTNAHPHTPRHIHSRNHSNTLSLSLSHKHAHTHRLYMHTRTHECSCFFCYNTSVCRTASWCITGYCLGCKTGNCLVPNRQARVHTHTQIHTHTHSLNHSFTPSLTHSLTLSLTHNVRKAWIRRFRLSL